VRSPDKTKTGANIAPSDGIGANRVEGKRSRAWIGRRFSSARRTFFAMPRSFFLWKEVKTHSFNPNEASTKQTTIEKNRNMKTMSLLAVMFLTAALSGPAAEAGKIPFNGTIEANESHPLFGAPPFMFYVNGGGTLSTTQLGQFTVAYVGMVTFASRAGNGGYRIIAANGDTIFTYSWGQATVTADPDVVSIVETNTITGGTGLYEDAKGSFTVNRLANRTTGATSGSFDGSIIVRGNP
jgi:hypothetical protein